MLRNYFLTTLRSIRKNKVFSVLNILGLAIGIASCILILQYVSFESSFDEFHSTKDRVFRLDNNPVRQGEERGRNPSTPYKLGETLQSTYSGIDAYCRLHKQYYGAVVTYNGESPEEERQFFEEDEQMYYVDQAFFDMFEYKLLQGDRRTLLSEPMSIVITKSMLEKYMPGVEFPIGKFLNVDGGWYPGTYKITGVLDDLPGNTMFSFNFLMSIEDLLKNRQYTNDDGWSWTNFHTYVMIAENAGASSVGDQIKDYYNEKNAEEWEAANFRRDVLLTSLTDIRLNDQTKDSGGITSETLFFFLLIAVFIICIAWLNYINLATAQAMKRAKEVAIRKVVGAIKQQLVAQFLMEAFVINLVSLLIALGLAFLCLPILSGVIDTELNFGVGIPAMYWLYFGLLFLLGTFLSGIYPAFVLSGFNPAVIVKGSVHGGRRRFGLRQVLVIGQLIIGVLLISGTLTAFRQLQYMRNSNLGMDVERVVSVRGPRVFEDRDKKNQKLKSFKEEVTNLVATKHAAISAAIPGGSGNWGTPMRRHDQAEAETQRIMMAWVDDNFHNVYGMELVAGRFHSKDLRGEEAQVVANETVVRKFGFESAEAAIGKKLRAGEDNLFTIIGVLKDFSWYSLKQESLSVLLNYGEGGSNVSVLLSGNIGETMPEIESLYESYFPGNPFDYYFMDEYFDRQYKADKQFGKIFTSFSIIAVVIACLGLFGLASFTLKLRVKEIGVRKVLGATVNSIVMMIYKDYVKLVLIATVIGLPLVYFALQNWLEGYANRISITADLFLVPIILLLLITLATISYQSFLAATNNPTKSLRTE